MSAVSSRPANCGSAPKRDPGGGGINVARVAYRLGGSVTAIFPTGGAIGKLLHRFVDREGIASLVTPSHVETRENFTAYRNRPANNIALSSRARSFIARNGNGSREIVVADSGRNSSWRAGASHPASPRFLRARRPPANPLGAQSVIDTSGPALKAALAHGVSVSNQIWLDSDLIGASLGNDEALFRVHAAR